MQIWIKCGLLGAVSASLFSGICHGKAEPPDAAVAAVFTDLTAVASDGRAAPTLQIVPESTGAWRIAWFDAAPGKRAIYLEQATVDLCRDGALAPKERQCVALVIGHELAHFYKDHARLLELARPDGGANPAGISGETRRMVEADADEVGGSYAALAGYDSFQISDQVLDATYKRFKVPSDIPGYPSLEARKSGLSQANAKIARMLPVFEAGNILFFAKHYVEAARCFDHVSRVFPSREVLNNAGSARLLAALETLGSHQAFVFPIEMDPESRMLRPEARKTRLDPAKLALSALQSFDKILAGDPKYVPALVNRSLALVILRRNSEASGAAETAHEIALQSDDAAGAADAAIAHGITAHYIGDDATARRDFESALASSPLTARANLSILSSEKVEARPKCASNAGPRERIGGRKPEELPKIVDSKTRMDADESLESTGPFAVYSLKGPAYAGYLIEFGNTALSALLTRPDYRECSTRGVCMGTRPEDVAAKYSCPETLGHYRRRFFLTYPSADIIFDFGPDQKLRRWITFVEDIT